MRLMLRRLPCQVAIVLVVATSPCLGQPSIWDPFDNGDLENPDRKPVTWNVFGEDVGTIEVIDGNVVMTPSEDDFMGAWIEFPSNNFRLRIVARFLGTPDRSGFIGLLGRDGALDGVGNNYWGGMRANGRLATGTVEDSNIMTITDNFPSGLDPIASDFVLEFKALGSVMTTRAWEAGSDPPAETPLRLMDKRFQESVFVQFFYNPSNGLTPVEIRSFEAITIPEPSGVTLLALAAVALARTVRMR